MYVKLGKIRQKSHVFVETVVAVNMYIKSMLQPLFNNYDNRALVPSDVQKLSKHIFA